MACWTFPVGHPASTQINPVSLLHRFSSWFSISNSKTGHKDSQQEGSWLEIQAHGPPLPALKFIPGLGACLCLPSVNLASSDLHIILTLCPLQQIMLQTAPIPLKTISFPTATHFIHSFSAKWPPVIPCDSGQGSPSYPQIFFVHLRTISSSVPNAIYTF